MIAVELLHDGVGIASVDAEADDARPEAFLRRSVNEDVSGAGEAVAQGGAQLLDAPADPLDADPML